MVRRERWILISGLTVLVLFAWVYLFYLSNSMSQSDMRMGAGMQTAMPAPMPWSRSEFLLTFLMWAVMMAGMMIPSAMPMVMIFDKLRRQRHPGKTAIQYTGLFVAGYLAAWTAYSFFAALAQGWLHNKALLDMNAAATSPLLGGLVLMAAGGYQFTKWKNACLRYCRSPLGYLMTEWRDGLDGAFRMGVQHGAFCLVCCWMLMALLFIVGVMNLLWGVVITVYVLIEKVAPKGQWISRAAGAGMLLWGVWILGSFLLPI
jgi:predicted metal-binding membrane protein